MYYSITKLKYLKRLKMIEKMNEAYYLVVAAKKQIKTAKKLPSFECVQQKNVKFLW